MVRRVALPRQLGSGAFTVSTGAEAGVTPKRLRGRDLERPFHGVRQRWCDEESGGDDTAIGLRAATVRRCRAYELRMSPTQLFSHTTAALLWRIPLPRHLEADPRLHVSALDGAAKPRSAGVHGHVVSDPAVRREIRGGLPVTDPVSTWLHLATLLGFDDLVAAGDHLVLRPRHQGAGERRPYALREELEERVIRFRGRNKAVVAAALGLVREGAESRRETLLRLALMRHGLPEPELNSAIHDAHGVLIGFGDLVYPAFKVVVEYDGEQHRTDSVQFYRDIERHEAFERASWMHVRETKETPSTGARSTPARTEFVLRARGWHTSR